MQVLVINVEDRIDRRNSISSHLNSLNFSYEVIKAVDKKQLILASNKFLSVDVERILNSHLKCLKIAANSQDDYTLIIEDDAILNFNFNDLKEILEYAVRTKIVFLQLGFLHLNVLDSILIWLRNVYDLFVKLNLFGKFFSRFGFHEIERASQQKWRKDLDTDYIMNDIRYGAHCYLIHSSFAHDLLLINDPHFLSIDDLYVSLGKMKSFRMARSKRTRAKQSKSPTSVSSRFVQE